MKKTPKLYFSFSETVSSGINKSFFSEITSSIIRKLKVDKDCEINLLLTDNKEIQKLNKVYRKTNCPTDVLAFGFKQGKEKFILPKDNISHLGDIVISLPKAKEQAKEYKHSVREEITILLIHGILHLLGFNHNKKNKALKMRKKEKEILDYLIEKTSSKYQNKTPFLKRRNK